MLRILFAAVIVTSMAEVCVAQLHSAVAAEYFWDLDPGLGSGTAISLTPGETVSLSSDISTNALSAGVHYLSVRVQREDGVWGEATRRPVRVGIGNTFDAAELFWDVDPGEGAATPLPLTANGAINESAFDVPDISRGFHWFNLRCKSGGTWSPPTGRLLRIGSAMLDGAEVYFDTDPGEGNGSPVDVVPGAEVIVHDSTISVLAAGEGFHSAFLRFRGGGVWSFPKSQTMRLGPWVDAGANRITDGEFFIDTDPGAGNGCPLIAEDGEFDEPDETMRRVLAGSDVGLGEHVIGLRVKDAGGRWFNTLLDTVEIIEAQLVTTAHYDSAQGFVRLMWNTYPEALDYRVHFDSVATGLFTGYFSVAPPDTFVELSSAFLKRFFQVVAIQTAPEPCTGTTLSQGH